jgi:predicted amidohydrolase
MEVDLCMRENNRKRLAEWMERFVKPSGSVTALALPELWDVGYCLQEAEKYAEPDGGAETKEFLANLARKYDAWFTSGSVLVKDGGSFFNRTFVIAPDGRVVDTYDKVHLLPFITSEVGILKGGRRESIYVVGPVSCGSVICYDIRFPEWIRNYALGGIDVLFVCGQWVKARMGLWRAMLCAHAIENMIYVVGVNCAGMSGDILYGGGSAVFAPDGEALFEASDKPQAGFVELDIDTLAKNRDFLKVFESRVPELYGRITQKNAENLAPRVLKR